MNELVLRENTRIVISGRKRITAAVTSAAVTLAVILWVNHSLSRQGFIAFLLFGAAAITVLEVWLNSRHRK